MQIKTMNTYKKQKNITSRTREDIVGTASHLFSEYIYSGISMSDIAKKLNIIKADIIKAALYYYFKSKDEIYREILDKIFFKLKSSE